MEKMKLAALDRDALKALFETNNHLQQITQESVWDIINCQFDEIANYFKHNGRYSYQSHDHYYSFYITVNENDYRHFIEDLDDANKDFGILSDDEKQLLNRLFDKIDFFEDLLYGYEIATNETWINLSNFVYTSIEKLKNSFEHYLHTIEDAAQDDQYLLETFLLDVDADLYDNMMTDGEKVYFEVCKG